jgi:hypothetical protein
MRYASVRSFWGLLLVLMTAPTGWAQFGSDQNSFRPRFTSTNSYAASGECYLRVQVDDEAEVSMSGSTVSLRTLRGRPNYDVGSECTSPLPGRFVVTDFRQTDGPGRADLVSGTGRSNHVSFSVRDPKGGDHKYTLQFRWTADTAQGGAYDGGAYGSSRGDQGYGRANRRANRASRNFVMSETDGLRMCEDAIRNRVATDYGYNNFETRSIQIDTRRGNARNQWIVGTGSVRAGFRPTLFQFDCRVDFTTGNLLDARVRR